MTRKMNPGRLLVLIVAVLFGMIAFAPSVMAAEAVTENKEVEEATLEEVQIGDTNVMYVSPDMTENLDTERVLTFFTEKNGEERKYPNVVIDKLNSEEVENLDEQKFSGKQDKVLSYISNKYAEYAVNTEDEKFYALLENEEGEFSLYKAYMEKGSLFSDSEPSQTEPAVEQIEIETLSEATDVNTALEVSLDNPEENSDSLQTIVLGVMFGLIIFSIFGAVYNAVDW